MDRKLKHLDFIQGVINRLSTNSFLLKGWSVVLVSALFALSASGENYRFVLLAYFPAIAFWALDGYFLALERAYRRLYEEIRVINENDVDFSMGVKPEKSGSHEWGRAFISKTLLVFHGSLIVSIVFVMFFTV